MTDQEGHEAYPALLSADEDGGITEKLERVLREIFDSFADASGHMSRDALNKFSRATNGEDMTDETFADIQEAFDMTDDGKLTLKGFVQLYSLQTESDPEETLNDLKKLGYDEKLDKVK